MFFFGHYSFGVVVVVSAIKSVPAALPAAQLLSWLFLVLSFHVFISCRCHCHCCCAATWVNGRKKSFIRFLFSHSCVIFVALSKNKRSRVKNNFIKKLREICQAAAPVGHNSIITSNVSAATPTATAAATAASAAAATSVATPSPCLWQRCVHLGRECGSFLPSCAPFKSLTSVLPASPECVRLAAAAPQKLAANIATNYAISSRYLSTNSATHFKPTANGQRPTASGQLYF
ncbi:uncharacterized protein LOC108658070 [Drosophila navojoa]|uniref:uncharacterized protein LOC108658070 n=1 Tax=Drosophila navojoa TaxID=7232 RepID=UPI0011BD506D|nr:uncharacterized protein LOC108658070 [Drosophila navojoa]